jgi:hypothetical protein
LSVLSPFAFGKKPNENRRLPCRPGVPLYLDSRKDGLSQRGALANNLPANAAEGERSVHAGTMMKAAAVVKPSPVSAINRRFPRAPAAAVNAALKNSAQFAPSSGIRLSQHE